MEYVTNSAFDHLPKGIARRFDSRYDVVIRTLDDGTRTELQPMLQTPTGEYVRFEDYAQLVEKCERLTKAGEAMIDEWWLQLSCPERMKASWMQEQAIVGWNAAKNGGQS
jgi:hypothetical protein